MEAFFQLDGRLSTTATDPDKLAHLQLGRQTFYSHLEGLNFAKAVEFVHSITPDRLPSGLDLEQLQYILSTYRLIKIRDFFSGKKNSYLQPNIGKFAEFALALQFAPRRSRQILPLVRFGEIDYDPKKSKHDVTFAQLPNQRFSSERLLLSSMVSPDDQLLYPDLNRGKRIVAATEFRVIQAQRYFMERAARAVFVRNRKLKKLYPVIKVGSTTYDQNPDGSLNQPISYGEKYPNVALFFPVGNTDELLNLALAKPHPKGYIGHYQNSGRIIGVHEDFLDRHLPNTDRNRAAILEVAIHEQNHRIFYDLPPTVQKEIMDMFDSEDPPFIQFTQSLSTSYIDDARYDLNLIPSLDALTIKDKRVKHSPFVIPTITISKKRIISELLARATAKPNISKDMQKYLIDDSRENAYKCVQALSPDDQQRLRDLDLITDVNSSEFQAYFRAFEEALTVIKPEYIPSYAERPARGRNRLKTSLAVLSMPLLVALGIAGYDLTHNGIGLTGPDGRGFNVQVNHFGSLTNPVFRLKWQDLEARTPYPDINVITGKFIYPQTVHATYYDLTQYGLQVSTKTETDYVTD